VIRAGARPALLSVQPRKKDSNVGARSAPQRRLYVRLRLAFRQCLHNYIRLASVPEYSSWFPRARSCHMRSSSSLTTLASYPQSRYRADSTNRDTSLYTTHRAYTSSPGREIFSAIPATQNRSSNLCHSCLRLCSISTGDSTLGTRRSAHDTQHDVILRGQPTPIKDHHGPTTS
jgi:hypothetical protein